MPLTITKPKVEDAQAIHEVMKASWYATYINNDVGVTKEDVDASFTPEIQEGQIESLKRRAEEPSLDDISLVAKDAGRVVGYIRLKVKAEDIEWLSLYAHPDYFGQGVGTALWQEAQKLLPPNLPIIAEVVTYTKAVDFYKKIGFTDTLERYSNHQMPVSKTPLPLMKLVLMKQFSYNYI